MTALLHGNVAVLLHSSRPRSTHALLPPLLPTISRADFTELLRPRYRRPLAIGMSLMLFQQVTGQPSVLYYGEEHPCPLQNVWGKAVQYAAANDMSAEEWAQLQQLVLGTRLS